MDMLYPPDIIKYAAMVSAIAKFLVDIVKMSFPKMPPNYSPLLALFFSLILSAGVILKTATVPPVVTNQVVIDFVVTTVITAILATASAVGITEMQKRVQKSMQEPETVQVTKNEEMYDEPD